MKKKNNRQIFEAMALVLQLGINMLVPIFACCVFGIWLGNKTEQNWMMIPFFFLGALAGGTSSYKMLKKHLK